MPGPVLGSGGTAETKKKIPHLHGACGLLAGEKKKKIRSKLYKTLEQYYDKTKAKKGE